LWSILLLKSTTRTNCTYGIRVVEHNLRRTKKEENHDFSEIYTTTKATFGVERYIIYNNKIF